MSEPKNHIIHYTESDIRRYLSGGMNASEMHALESAAIDDPFLADAIEGLLEATGAHGEKIVTEQFDIAKKQIQERIKEKKPGTIIPIFWKRAAVAAVLVILAGTWIYTSMFSDSSPEKEIAVQPNQDKNISEYPESDSAPNIHENVQPAIAADSTTPIDHSSLVDSEPASAQTAKNIAQNKEVNEKHILPFPIRSDKNSKDEPKINASAPVKEPLAARESNQLKTIARSEKTDDAEVKSRAEESGNVQTGIVNIPDNKKSMDSFTRKVSDPFNLKVVDANNIPISGATVTFDKMKKLYLTDQNGILRISIPDTAAMATVSSVGYQSKSFMVSSLNAINKVQLVPENNLSETVVIGYGTQGADKKEKINTNRRAPKVMVQDAEPAIGWVEYNKYLDSARATVNAPISGDVVVSFIINKEGESSNYRIEQSVDKAQDAAALEIVKKGSAWRLLKGKKQRVYVIIRY